jgi:hypothetical protein
MLAQRLTKEMQEVGAYSYIYRYIEGLLSGTVEDQRMRCYEMASLVYY